MSDSDGQLRQSESAVSVEQSDTGVLERSYNTMAGVLLPDFPESLARPLGGVFSEDGAVSDDVDFFRNFLTARSEIGSVTGDTLLVFRGRVGVEGLLRVGLGRLLVGGMDDLLATGSGGQDGSGVVSLLGHGSGSSLGHGTGALLGYGVDSLL